MYRQVRALGQALADEPLIFSLLLRCQAERIAK